MSTAGHDEAIAQLRLLESALGPDAPTEEWTGAVTERMDIQPYSPGWLARLVNEFASTRNPEFANSLAFTLAGAANHESRAPWVAPLIVDAMVGLAVDCPWPRLNLCTGVERVLMLAEFPPSVGLPIPGLASLLLTSLASNDLVRAPAANVVFRLRCHGPRDAVPPAEWAQCEATVLSFVGSADMELDDIARALRDRIARDAASAR